MGVVVTSEATCSPGDPPTNEQFSSKQRPPVEAHTLMNQPFPQTHSCFMHSRERRKGIISRRLAGFTCCLNVWLTPLQSISLYFLHYNGSIPITKTCSGSNKRRILQQYIKILHLTFKKPGGGTEKCEEHKSIK